jgi:hypothetical protein
MRYCLRTTEIQRPVFQKKEVNAYLLRMISYYLREVQSPARQLVQNCQIPPVDQNSQILVQFRYVYMHI